MGGRGKTQAQLCSTLIHTMTCETFTAWQDACQQFANSVSSLPPDDAERVGRDPGGSRVLEALVAGAASGKQKARLLRALHGCWAGLAAEFAGSHLVEKCFAAAVRLGSEHVQPMEGGLP